MIHSSSPLDLTLLSFFPFVSSVLMDSGFDHVRSLLGDFATSDLTDKQIKDSLWYYYFDADKTVAWLLEEKEKAVKKAEKKNGKLRFLSVSFSIWARARFVGRKGCFRPMEGARVQVGSLLSFILTRKDYIEGSLLTPALSLCF